MDFGKGIILGAFLAAACWAGAQSPPQNLPSAAERETFRAKHVLKYGCSITSNDVGRYETHIYMEYPKDAKGNSPRWTFYFSERDTRKQAMTDCNKWLDETKKKIEEDKKRK